MLKEKRLVPQLRFSEFEGEWKRRNIKDILTIGSGKDYKDLKSGDIPVYGSGGLMTKVNDYLYDGESIGIGRKGTIDKPIFLKGKFWTVDTLFYTHTFLESYPKFIFSQFQRINWKLHNEASSIPSLSKSTIAKIKINITSLEEQQKIANFLTAMDNRIYTLEKKKILLEQYKKGVLQKIFKQELRFKDDTSTSLSTSDGKAYPEWEEKKLGKLTYKVGKKNKENISYPIYSINNQEGFRPQSEQFEGLDSNDRGYDISLYKIVNKETFAYNPARINVGSIGYSFELNEVIISSLYVCFKTNKELEDLYLLAYLDTNKFNKNILRYEEGGVRQYLFYENFSQIKIPLPSNAEQTKIANFLSAIDISVELVTKKIEHTKTFKKGLLQQMFV